MIHTFAAVGFACAWHGGLSTPGAAVGAWKTLSSIDLLANPFVQLGYLILTLAVPTYSGQFHNIILALLYTVFGGLQWFVIFGKVAGYTRDRNKEIRKNILPVSDPFKD